MTALELIQKNYNGTSIASEPVKGLKNLGQINDLDCDCVDGDCTGNWAD